MCELASYGRVGSKGGTIAGGGGKEEAGGPSGSRDGESGCGGEPESAWEVEAGSDPCTALSGEDGGGVAEGGGGRGVGEEALAF